METTREQEKNRFAYVTFVMRNDSYIPGALVLAHRLRKMGTAADIVCLVTPQITTRARLGLKEVFDHVVEVEEVYIQHGRAHERQDRPFLFTRFQALRLCSDGGLGLAYDRIVLLDADIMPLYCYDDLFSLPAPAGIINEYKEYCIPKGNYDRTDGKWNWHDQYDEICPHGTRIPAELTDRVAVDPMNLGVNACLWVLEPDMDTYQEIMRTACEPAMQEKIQVFNWPEMQFATLFWSGKWTNVDLRYASFNSQPRLDVLFGTHFAGLKPWSERKTKSLQHYFQFEDYQMWYAELMEMASWRYPALQKLPKIRRLMRLYSTFLKTDKAQ